MAGKELSLVKLIMRLDSMPKGMRPQTRRGSTSRTIGVGLGATTVKYLGSVL